MRTEHTTSEYMREGHRLVPEQAFHKMISRDGQGNIVKACALGCYNVGWGSFHGLPYEDVPDAVKTLGTDLFNAIIDRNDGDRLTVLEIAKLLETGKVRQWRKK